MAAPSSSAIDPRLRAPDTTAYRGDATRPSMADLMKKGTFFADDGTAAASTEGVPIELDAAPKEDVGTKLDWKTGVLIPVLLNIWGVIMFLRLGWVAGQAGLLQGTLIIVASNVVTLITALSMCAISTNGEVKGGGAYYLISRALGPSYGGAIGLLFFVAQAVATSMYVVGFAESIVDIFRKGGAEPFTGDWAWDQRIIGLITCVVLLGVAFVGVGWYAKCQVFLLVILMAAMASVVIGAFFPEVPDEADNALQGFVGYDGIRNFLPEYTTDTSTFISNGFFSVFAVFFPAVTGIMAGANMSGDLANPSVAIPKGTLWGIGVTWISYIFLLWIVGCVSLRCVGDQCSVDNYGEKEWAESVGDAAPTGGLVYNKLIMAQLSLWAPLVYAGVFAATLSSALASIVGAPRILQAVASDELFAWRALNFFGGKGEPRRGYVLTFAIACGCVLIGELDLIAPLISNFFMISYALTNYACFAASMSKAPGWRPSFRYYNKYLSACGALLCVAVMFAFDWFNSLVSVTIGLAVFQYLEWTAPKVDWGPASNARRYVKAVRAMRDLVEVQSDSSGRGHVKTFRPQYLVMSGQPKARADLVKFVAALSKGGGVNFFCDVLMGDRGTAPDLTIRELCNRARDEGLKYLTDVEEVGRAGKKYSFMEAVKANSVREGLQAFLQLGGMGGLRPNTVLLGYKRGWMTKPVAETQEYEQLLFEVIRNKMGLVVLRDRDFFDKAAVERNVIARTSSRRVSRTLTPNPARRDHTRTRPLIDVWWLSDDGGLTILLPHLLRMGRGQQAWDIRVLTVGKPAETSDGVQTLTETEKKMKHLMEKFRIRADVRSVHRDVQEDPSPVTVRWYTTKFADLVPPRRLGSDAPLRGTATKEDLEATSETKAAPDVADKATDETKEDPAHFAEVAEQTRRMLRLGDVVREFSSTSQVVFISMPLPTMRGGQLRARQYMSWLEALSRNLPPTVMVLGNNTPVLTFFS